MTNAKQPHPSESLREKVILLVIDKLVIGALLAVAFVLYDRWKTADVRSYERVTQERDFSFRRPEYIRTLVPLIVSSETDMRLRLQAFGALVDTRAIDPGSAVQLAQDLVDAGALENDLRPLPVGQSMGSEAHPEFFAGRSGTFEFLKHSLLRLSPELIEPSIDRYRYARRRSELLQRSPDSASSSAKELSLWRGAEGFWQAVLHDAADQYVDSLDSPFDGGNIGTVDEWMTILGTNSTEGARRWARSRSALLRLIGNIHLLYWQRDASARAYIAAVVDGPADATNLQYAYAVLTNFRESKIWSPEVAQASLAVLLKGRSPPPSLKDTSAWGYRWLGSAAYLSQLSASDSVAIVSELVRRAVVALERFPDRVRATPTTSLSYSRDNRTAETILVEFLISADSVHHSRMSLATDAALTAIASAFEREPEKSRLFGLYEPLERWRMRRSRH